MKILFISSLYYPNIMGGAEISIQMFAEKLVSNGVEITVITSSDTDYTDHVNGVKIYYISHSNLFWLKDSATKAKIIKPLWYLIDLKNLKVENKIKSIIDSEHPDLVHTSNLIGLSSSIWGLCKKIKIPLLHTLMDYYPMCRKSTLYNKGKNCTRRCFSCKVMSFSKKVQSQKVDAVIGISDFILGRHLEEGYFRNALRYMIGLPAYMEPVVANPKKVLNDPLVFGFIGLLARTKGIELLLDSFFARKDSLKLVVMGKAKNEEYENFLKDKYKSSNIEFLGFCDTKRYLPGIDVLVIPSISNEPFGRVIVEAYAYGVPVLASGRGGIAELVKNGKTGWIFSPETERDLYAKIDYLKKNSNQILNMSRNCILEAQKYTIDIILEKYMEIYKTLLLNI